MKQYHYLKRRLAIAEKEYNHRVAYSYPDYMIRYSKNGIEVAQDSLTDYKLKLDSNQKR